MDFVSSDRTVARGLELRGSSSWGNEANVIVWLSQHSSTNLIEQFSHIIKLEIIPPAKLYTVSEKYP
jgi:hypothetical protein